MEGQDDDGGGQLICHMYPSQVALGKILVHADLCRHCTVGHFISLLKYYITERSGLIHSIPTFLFLTVCACIEAVSSVLAG
jgi:xanthine dehydrogenase iron-sulfur cluster and FAD-binding subunit A